MRYRFIEQQRREQLSQRLSQQHKDPTAPGPGQGARQSRQKPSVLAWCRILQVSRSGYHSFLRRRPSKRAQEQAKLLEGMRAAHEASRRTYGSPRVYAELREQGYRCGVNRVARLMREHQLTARTRPRFVTTTDSRHELPVANNLLAQDFSAEAADTRWACDFTYVWTSEGWLYLAVVLDLYSRRIIGWSLKTSMERELVMAALQAALGRRRPQEGLMCHSDRGSQYASSDYQHQLKEAGMVCSMSRKGNCYDNAAVESFFATLKRELSCAFETREEARLRIFEWIETWYNRQRRHSTLGYLSPEEFERRYEKGRCLG